MPPFLSTDIHQIRMKILPKCSYFSTVILTEYKCIQIDFRLTDRKDFSTLQNTVIGNADTVYGKQLWLIWITSSHLLMLKISNIRVKPKDFLLEIKWLSNSVGFTLISDLTQFCFTRHCVSPSLFHQWLTNQSRYILQLNHINALVRLKLH